ncbi:MAG TPA: PKD domain-containing protein, partial [Gemmatimonadales bacterium]|nr:PKD domain-containing protein [Gemmatimonadales bacterium]
MTNLGTAGSNLTTRALAINNAGLIAGEAVFTQGEFLRGFVLSAGTFTKVEIPGDYHGYASAVNDNGQVAGVGFNTTSGTVPFLWTSSIGIEPMSAGINTTVRGMNQSGVVVGSRDFRAQRWPSPTIPSEALGVIGEHGEATAINQAGDIVGYRYPVDQNRNPVGPHRAFLWRPATGMVDLGVLPGDACSFATGMNDMGQVVGVSASLEQICAGAAIQQMIGVDSGVHGFIWTASGGMLPLGNVPSGAGSVPRGINNSGIVVGYSSAPVQPGCFIPRAFVWTPLEGMRDLGPPVSSTCAAPFLALAWATAINDQNQIVGAANLGTNIEHAAMWTLQFASANQPPVANPGGRYWGIRGQAIAFDAGGSTDPEGEAMTFAWDFGDGTTGSGATPTHTYGELGAYQVSLAVTDASGATSVATTTATAGLPTPLVVAGEKYSCALRASGTARCWGSSPYGGSNVPSNLTFTQLSAGFSTTCGLKADGTIGCYGSDGSGQTSFPAGTFADAGIGKYHGCALDLTGELSCWGLNAFHAKDLAPGQYSQVSAGWLNTCALRPDGTIACAGINYPTNGGPITPPAGVYIQVSTGEHHACALRPDRTMLCWGYNNYGEVGGTPVAAAVTYSPAGTFREVRAGIIHTCAVRSDGTVACWGYNVDGRSSPPSGTFASVAASSAHSCGVRTEGT